jgi:hypothetical protein
MTQNLVPEDENIEHVHVESIDNIQDTEASVVVMDTKTIEKTCFCKPRTASLSNSPGQRTTFSLLAVLRAWNAVERVKTGARTDTTAVADGIVGEDSPRSKRRTVLSCRCVAQQTKRKRQRPPRSDIHELETDTHRLENRQDAKISEMIADIRQMIRGREPAISLRNALRSALPTIDKLGVNLIAHCHSLVNVRDGFSKCFVRSLQEAVRSKLTRYLAMSLMSYDEETLNSLHNLKSWLVDTHRDLAAIGDNAAKRQVGLLQF